VGTSALLLTTKQNTKYIHSKYCCTLEKKGNKNDKFSFWHKLGQIKGLYGMHLAKANSSAHES